MPVGGLCPHSTPSNHRSFHQTDPQTIHSHKQQQHQQKNHHTHSNTNKRITIPTVNVHIWPHPTTGHSIKHIHRPSTAMKKANKSHDRLSPVTTHNTRHHYHLHLHKFYNHTRLCGLQNITPCHVCMCACLRACMCVCMCVCV